MVKSNNYISNTFQDFFDKEVKKYCYMWREGGQFSTKKYNSTKDIENKIS